MAGASEPAESPGAPEVTVRIPGLLARFTDGQRTATIRATTVAASVDGLLEAYPALEPHLYDGNGQLRPHLKLFLDGTGVAVDEAGDVGLEAGDEVVVLQAVSGG
jgi:molybdopterin converting factor small subunit